jgi:polyisoprenoid-binding protein YceI
MLTRVKTAVSVLTLLASTAAAQKAGGSQQGKATAKPPAPPRFHFVVASTGNEARYRVREQLVGVDLPNDAVGTTQAIAGTLLVDAAGNVVRDSSRITVTITGLKSDKDRRDNFIRRRTMETEKYPTVELVPTALRGLTARPKAGPSTFELIGDLTVHGVTRPSTWKVNAHSEGDDLVGSATTAFTFKDFALDQPRVPIVLSVEDTIKLEYDFRFTQAAKTP